ncbi:MAG: NAD(P)-binding domain-containing protein [Gammaproteobacteria bacterium]|nr:NAD(P)-binding domain-containing protein [Gammaproteobacteria bacterium]
MNIIIIGAGSIGGAIASQMIETGHDVKIVARNKRFIQLQRQGMLFKKILVNPFAEVKTRHLKVDVIPELLPDIPADIIILTVQRQHLDALLPSLEAHPCPRIVCMFNYAGDFTDLRQRFGERLFWAFPAMLAGFDADTGISHHFILPRVLSFLQITTIGSIQPGASRQTTASKQILVDLFNQAGIPSKGVDQMEAWLKTHSALMLPLIAYGVHKLKMNQSFTLSWSDSNIIASAIGECFQLLHQNNITLTPFNLQLLDMFVPKTLMQLSLFILFRFKIVHAMLEGHADHASGEVVQLYSDFSRLADQNNISLDMLKQLCDANAILEYKTT